jgi:hypothetical protein
MHGSKWEKPATACGEPASRIERFGGLLNNSNTPNVIAAQLFGSDVAVAGNIKARNALDLCRDLLALGADPNAALLCYRGNQLVLRIRAIGEGAKLTVREDGLRVVPWKAFSRRDVSPPMRQNDGAVS